MVHQDEEAAVGDAQLVVVVDEVGQEEISAVICRHHGIDPDPVGNGAGGSKSGTKLMAHWAF